MTRIKVIHPVDGLARSITIEATVLHTTDEEGFNTQSAFLQKRPLQKRPPKAMFESMSANTHKVYLNCKPGKEDNPTPLNLCLTPPIRELEPSAFRLSTPNQ